MLRTSLLLLALGAALPAAPPAAAQSAARSPRTVAGVCGTANWVCVAECIDVGCMDNCLREGCESALARLEKCTAKARCDPDDTTCAARACGETCQKAFEPAPPSPEREVKDPCARFPSAGAGRVPEEVVGTWTLSAATLTHEPPGTPVPVDPKPRADYERSLVVTPGGCFLLRTALDDATLGRGNALDVRAWGTFDVVGKDRVVLRTADGQAVGPVCGSPRVIGLKKGHFQGPAYRFSVEDGLLTLTAEDPSKRTFQFRRVQDAPAKDAAPKGAPAQGPT